MIKRGRAAHLRVGGLYRRVLSVVTGLTGPGQVVQAVSPRTAPGHDVFHAVVVRGAAPRTLAIFTSAFGPFLGYQPGFHVDHRLIDPRRVYAEFLHEGVNGRVAYCRELDQVLETFDAPCLQMIGHADCLLLLLISHGLRPTFRDELTVAIPKGFREAPINSGEQFRFGQEAGRVIPA